MVPHILQLPYNSLLQPLPSTLDFHSGPLFCLAWLPVPRYWTNIPSPWTGKGAATVVPRWSRQFKMFCFPGHSVTYEKTFMTQNNILLLLEFPEANCVFGAEYSVNS